MEGRYGISEGFPEGKSEGWNGRPKTCPPGGGLWPAIPFWQLSLRKSLGKPIPSLHWLIRIYHSLPSWDGRYIILFHPFPVTGRVVWFLSIGEGKVILSLSQCDLWDPLNLRVIFYSWELNLEGGTSANIGATFALLQSWCQIWQQCLLK